MKTRFKFLVLATVLGLSACAGVATTQSGALGVSRRQTMFLSSQEVADMSATSYHQTLAKLQAAGALNADRKLTLRVKHVSQRLIAQTGYFRPDAPSWKWEVNVATSQDLNAYAMAGGKIMVYSGLVTRLSLSDDELATVLGHEIAHALREHTREAMSEAWMQQTGLSLVTKLAGLSAGQQQLAMTVVDLGLSKPHSRTMESEADMMGLELMARAGFNPQASTALWQKMMSGNKGAPPEFMSTHPSDTTRMASLSAAIPTVMPLYQAARRKS